MIVSNFLLVFIFFIAAFLVPQYVKGLNGLYGGNSLYDEVKIRMDCYADLLGLNDNVNSFTPSGAILSVGQHKILLGTLKKIEAKNGVLGAVNAAFLTLVVAYVTAFRASLDQREEMLLVVVAGLLVSNIILRVDGNSHLGQGRFRKIRKSSLFAVSLRKKMQEDLIKNLVEKEAYFHYSVLMLGLAFLGAIFLLV